MRVMNPGQPGDNPPLYLLSFMILLTKYQSIFVSLWMRNAKIHCCNGSFYKIAFFQSGFNNFFRQLFYLTSLSFPSQNPLTLFFDSCLFGAFFPSLVWIFKLSYSFLHFCSSLFSWINTSFSISLLSPSQYIFLSLSLSFSLSQPGQRGKFSI